ncbi:glycosyltransferase family 4 protein [Bacillus cereus]
MLKIAILGTEDRPIPATRGGAVESLVEEILRLNTESGMYKIDVYSIYEEQAATLMEKNDSYHFINRNPNSFQKIFNLISLKMNFVSLYRNKFVDEAVTLINEKEYDWVIVQNRPAYIIPIRKKVKNKSTKFALHLHNEHFINIKADSKIYNQYNLILTVSNYIKSQVLQKTKVFEDMVQVWFNVVNTTKFNQERINNEIVESFLKKHKLSKGQIVVFYGRLIPEKGVLEVIEAFKQVMYLLPNLKLCIFGSLEKNNEYHRKLIDTAGNLVGDKIIFTGYISYNSIESYLSVGTIFVLPSIWEDPCPLTVLETLSMGKPLITTKSGGIIEMASNRTGFILERNPALVNNIAEKIKFLCNHPNERVKMGNYARNKIVNECNCEDYLLKFKNIINAYAGKT